MITGFVDIPTAYLHEFKRRIERETEAKDVLSKANVKDIAEYNSQDKEFIANTANYYSIQHFKEAGNRRSILEKTIGQLGTETFCEDIPEIIDEDWLAKFSKIASDVSKEEVQFMLAKILAGEISNPGSFSSLTLKVLERIDKKTANEFIRFMSHCCTIEKQTGFTIITIPNYQQRFRHKRGIASMYIDNYIDPDILPRLDDFSLIIDVGILRPIEARRTISISDLKSFSIGSTQVFTKHYQGLSIDNDDSSEAFKCLELTSAGMELRDFIEKEPAPTEYCESLDKFLIRKLALTLDYPNKKRDR